MTRPAQPTGKDSVMDDLVERLRTEIYPVGPFKTGRKIERELIEERRLAADRIEAQASDKAWIEALEAENARLREELGFFNKLGADANDLFRKRLGERKSPTWFAVNALQDAVGFCQLYRPRAALAAPAMGGDDGE